MREHIGSPSPMSHSLGTFLAKQESTAPGRDRKYRSGDCHTSDIGHWFAMTCVLGKLFDKQKFIVMIEKWCVYATHHFVN